ncbi:MAG: hypothetical protein Kow001_18040 [Acidobacteriota bacterium]
MDARFYRLLRDATAEEFYNAINDPEDILYDVVWDLFEKVVIEPGEVFDEGFRDRNQFRFSIDSEVVMEFFPEADYFGNRVECNPYRDDGDAAGVHLRLCVQPGMSCLFSVAFVVWGPAERQALQNLWYHHRDLLSVALGRVKPMVACRIPYPAVEHAATLQEMLDNYFLVSDSEQFLAFQYPFPQVENSDDAQVFMTTMSMLYHAVRALSDSGQDRLEELYERLLHHHAGHLPDLPSPLPCVEMPIATDAG